MSPALYRHGDVLLQSVQAPPAAIRRLPHLILAHGETTGHTHRIAEQQSAALYHSSANNDAEHFLQVTAPHATLLHEEHGPIRLPAGWYRVWQQREYAPGQIRTVID